LTPKIFASKINSAYKILWPLDKSCCRDKVNRAAGRLRQLADGALFFALHRDYFVVTRNFIAVYLDLVPSNSFTATDFAAAKHMFFCLPGLWMLKN
jgi:hypothetical protein